MAMNAYGITFSGGKNDLMISKKQITYNAWRESHAKEVLSTISNTDDPFYDDINLVKCYLHEEQDSHNIRNHDIINGIYDRLNALNPELVIDVGCGHNFNKEKVQNLIGFDAMPYPNADMCCTILQAPFEENCADAIIAFSSMQMLNEEYRLECYEKIISWVKPNGLLEMRTNPFGGRKLKMGPNPHLGDSIESINGYTDRFNLEYIVAPFNDTLCDVTNIRALSKKLGITSDDIFKEKFKARVAKGGLWARKCRQIYWTWRKPF